MAEENKNSEQGTGNSEQKAQPQPAPQTPTQVPPNQGMSSGAKWGIGIGACCCCLIAAFLIFIILGFAGCTMVRGIGGYNWPDAPAFDEGTEIPIPSFSTTPR